MRIFRTVAPANHILTLDEAKAQLRVDTSDDDDLLARYIRAAESHLDGYQGVLGRALVTQDWSMMVRNWSKMALPLPDVQSIVSVTYLDGLGEEQTLETDSYYLDYEGDWPCICFLKTPAIIERGPAIKITSRHGFGDTADDVPEAIRHAAALLVGHYDSNREAVTPEHLRATPLAVRSLITPFIMKSQF